MKVGFDLSDFLSTYNPRDYDDPSVTTDIAILTIKDNDLKVLLIERGNFPFKGCKALPGGFLDVGRKENLEETAARELVEETNAKTFYMEQLKTYGDVERDPRKRVITVVYYALVPYSFFEKQKIEAGDDAAPGSAKWYSLKKPPQKMAFDHKMVLKDLLDRVRGKVGYTEIAFKLIPPKFTWKELQDVYEIILGRPLLASNFRRKILSMYKLKELKMVRKVGVGRPSALLQYVKMKKKF